MADNFCCEDMLTFFKKIEKSNQISIFYFSAGKSQTNLKSV